MLQMPYMAFMRLLLMSVFSYFPTRFCNIKFIKIFLIAIFVIVSVTNVLLITYNCVHIKTKTEGSFIETRRNEPKMLAIEVFSSKSKVFVMVNGIKILLDEKHNEGRGIHIVVLNEVTGAVTSHRVFDTYSPHEDDAVINFVSILPEKRFIIFCLKDEGSFHMNLKAKLYLMKFGSKSILRLGWRDMWAMVVKKGVKVLGESYRKNYNLNSWSSPVLLKVNVTLDSTTDQHCDWSPSNETERRKMFCNQYDGYADVCACTNPAAIAFQPTSFPDNKMDNVPVAVIASNRPYYLYRMLNSLLLVNGIRLEMITIYIDGFYEEPLAVANLFNIKWVQHAPIGSKTVSVSQHYKSSIVTSFQSFPKSQHIILLEEDLDVSPDLLSYFSQTLNLLVEDSSILCISAWNDQGYLHTSVDNTILYRVESMPGLGILLSKSLFQNELHLSWPFHDKKWDWDVWMRTRSVRKGRECVIPEVSRTYHFGAIGVNMNTYFHEHYFKSHAFNSEQYVKLNDVQSLKRENYEELITNMIRNGYIVNHKKDPCEDDFLPYIENRTAIIIYIKMKHGKDFGTWLRLAKCFEIWDLDARGYHNNMWRLRMKGRETLVIGYPKSIYSRFKPPDVVPIRLKKRKTLSSS